jgi:hypothetical protein
MLTAIVLAIPRRYTGTRQPASEIVADTEPA